jgi:trk system potassium uptake protein TrkA
MRTVFVGAGEITLQAAEQLLNRGHEVIIIEAERERIDELSEKYDCGFLHGDGSKPTVLGEADPANTDILYCLSDNDQYNIIASLVGRKLGFKEVITRIEDPEFESICRELGLENTIIPSRTISRYLADMVEGIDILELSSAIKRDARLFDFIAKDGDEGRIEELGLPERARVICLYRNGNFYLADEVDFIQAGDEVVLLTHAEWLPELSDIWKPSQLEKK